MVITGLLCGMVVALIALLFNPLTPRPVIPGTESSTYKASPLEFHGVELDEVGLLGLPFEPVGVPQAADSLAASNASILVLRGAGGEEIGVATRIVTLDGASNILLGDLGTETYTNIFFPNSGSLFLHGHESRWALVRSNVLGGRGERAVVSWPVTTKRRDNAPSGVVGGSGVFEGVGGRYVEMLQPGNAFGGVLESQISLDLSAR
jgi:hypothetical protein